MTRSRLPGAHRLGSRTIKALGAALVGTGLLAATVLAAITTVNVEVPDRNGYAAGKTDEGAIVEYIGDLNTTFGSSGSGIFDSFVRVQENDDEKGYNTDGDLEFDTKAGAFTHSIKVSEIPLVPCASLDGLQTGAGLCWELFADLNESDSTKQITLDALEVYLTSEGAVVNDDGDGPDLTGYPFSGNTAKVFDSDDQVRINDVNQGSGRGDLRYLVPVTGISIPGNCGYGNAACTTYFVLYSEYGFTDGAYDSDGGFEEWKVKRYPFLSVTKTANTTFTRTFAWTIDKSADPTTWALFDGDTGTSDWTVAVTKDAGTDTGWAVSGTITITNPSDQDAPIASVTDVISGAGAGAATVVCPVTFPYTLPHGNNGNTLICTYSRSLPDGASRTNTATATLTSGPVFTGTAPVTFGTPTTLVNDTVDVTDTNGMAWNDIDDDFSDSYPETFACGDDEGTHTNTATITQTGQHDSATVTVTCYDLTVTKTADESFARDFDWTILKSVDPESLDMFDGDSSDVTWTVDWTKSAAQDAGYAVEGVITVTNNHPDLGAVINSVSDVIAGPIVPNVDCHVTFPYTIAGGGHLDCDYDSSLPNNTTRLNTATATQQNYDYASDMTATEADTTPYSGTASIDFTGVVPTVTDNTATLSDARPGNTIDGDSVSASGSASWNETFACGADEGSHTNSATVTEDNSLDSDTDDATTVVNCYQLTVEKNADTSFDRDYDWTVAKTRVFAQGEVDGDLDPTTLTIDPNQTYTLTYEITVGLADPAFTDSNWAAAGSITVSNPAPIVAEDVVVTDVITGFAGTIALDCDAVTAGEQTTVDIPANGSVECSYSADLPDGTTRTNTATATLFGIGYDGTASIDFGDADIALIDECVVVTDDNGTPGNTADDTVLDSSLCANEAPHTYTNTITVGPFEVCGEFTFTNTAHIVAINDANDTGESHSASYTVVITVPCPEGCTLTPGYWKTHNELFWGGAPDDPVWYLSDLDGDGVKEGPNEAFFGTGKTWFQVFWTAPAGRPYYQLSFQYMAAVLNKLSIEDQGGTIPSSIQDAIDDAAALLDQYDTNADLKGKDAQAIRPMFVSLAGILGDFNSGVTGPGHCDEDGTSTAAAAPTGTSTKKNGGIVLLPFGLLPLGIGAFRRRRSKA